MSRISHKATGLVASLLVGAASLVSVFNSGCSAGGRTTNIEKRMESFEKDAAKELAKAVKTEMVIRFRGKEFSDLKRADQESVLAVAADAARAQLTGVVNERQGLSKNGNQPMPTLDINPNDSQEERQRKQEQWNREYQAWVQQQHSQPKQQSGTDRVGSAIGSYFPGGQLWSSLAKDQDRKRAQEFSETDRRMVDAAFERVVAEWREKYGMGDAPAPTSAPASAPTAP